MSEDEEMTTTLPVPAAFALSTARPPKDVLDEARRAAVALKGVVDAKPADKKVIMNGEVYFELEDWLMVAAFFGCTPRIKDDRVVDYAGTIGWEAEAELVNNTTGLVIGGARGMCLRDEPKWSSRPKYDWMDDRDVPQGVKVAYHDTRRHRSKIQIGDEPVPFFQLRSMAQTRAIVKTLSTVFRWVVVLAGPGYRPTPAEEMTGTCAKAHSWSKMYFWSAVQPIPPCSRGQVGVIHPLR